MDLDNKQFKITSDELTMKSGTSKSGKVMTPHEVASESLEKWTIEILDKVFKIKCNSNQEELFDFYRWCPPPDSTWYLFCHSYVRFKTEQNNEPVRDFLKALSPEDKKSVGADIMAVEMLWPIGYPMVRKLDTDLWEVRTGISDKRICRIMFTVSGNTMILLDLFDNCVVE